MSQNYRVVRKVVNGVQTFAIHEAYYYSLVDENPYDISTDGIIPTGNTTEDLLNEIREMESAFDKTVLQYSDYH